MIRRSKIAVRSRKWSDPFVFGYNKGLPLLCGVVVFFALGGHRILNFQDRNWLLRGDTRQLQLGWEFYRNQPFDLADPSKIADYGPGSGTSLIYADALPLLSIPLKIVSPLLPETFQFAGIWILLCMILMAHFSFRLGRLLSSSKLTSGLVAIFMLISPGFLYRLVHAESGQYVFLGIWVTVWAFCLFLSPTSSILEWSVCAACTILIHPYLIPFTLGVWATDVIRRLIRESRDWRLVKRLFTMIAVVLFACWLGGYFTVPLNGATSEYVGFNSNLSSFVDSGTVFGSGFTPQDKFSILLSDLPEITGNSEGFAFLGIGVLLLLVLNMSAKVCGSLNFTKIQTKIGSLAVLALLGIVWSRSALLTALILSFFVLVHVFRLILGKGTEQKLRILGVVTLAFWIYSLGNMLSFSSSNVLSIGNPVTETLYPIWRTTGRFNLPLCFLITVTCVVGVCSSRLGKSVVVIALIIQLFDGRGTIHEVRNSWRKVEFVSPFIDSTWTELGQQYNKILVLPASNFSEWNLPIADLASRSGMTTNAAYLGRFDEVAAKADYERSLTDITEGFPEMDSVYVALNEVSANILLDNQYRFRSVKTVNDLVVALP